MSRHHLTALLCAALVVLSATESCKKAENVRPVDDGPTSEAKPKPGGTVGREYTLVPDAQGRLLLDGTNNIYKPGDVINLKGNFSAVVIKNLSGSASAPIIVRNPKGAVTTIGNPSWSGGSWATALSFVNCHYIKAGSETSKAEFLINGSTQTGKEAYFDLALSSHTDNFEIRNITISNGGTGIWAKTDPVKGDASTQYPNSWMENLSIHDVTVQGTNNEAMYIGHTALYWNLTANTPYYGATAGFVPGQEYVQPIKWRNVKIYNNIVQNIGADGIQTAASDKLEIYGNTVVNWGLQQNSAHNGGILVGGRTTNTNTHDNYVHDGWGEMLQFYGSGENGAQHIIHNNLFANSKSAHDGISLRGTDKALVTVSNNTVARAGGVSLRINGYFGMTTAVNVNGNAFIEPRTFGGTVTLNSYIYTENTGSAIEGTSINANAKFATVADAGVDANNMYQPVSTSKLASAGYRK
ncbi:MAG TPA: right-handed parallel beta-helix repeat-containing protein [Chitinophaga sp.]|uniref:right-handed parallel beta-helix repeat-containing protein n=1 Tax=Chitinophaga sp. TaxID=1869181 RepID=UPI002B6860E6|nr:right-handed parallel beta-helix repeat-containing protein [Chitinophaga sp.]HVI45288.1 right-handed parallel beta-helix repeat-containing protein [Chitinophaga sp.]